MNLSCLKGYVKLYTVIFINIKHLNIHITIKNDLFEKKLYVDIRVVKKMYDINDYVDKYLEIF